MCGIVAYIGNRQAYPILINGLKRLEYRGYDSAGISIVDIENNISVYKHKGKVADLEAFINQSSTQGTIGMGHTRWATHGQPTDANAHPHESTNKKFIIIHNGIIENYASLRKTLELRGHTFQSETDTEVLVNLIEEMYKEGKTNAEDAVKAALKKVEGAFGIVVMCKDEPEQLIASRRGSPLVVGLGEDEFFLASDATPIIEYTQKVIYLEDDDVAVITRNELSLKTIYDDVLINPDVHELEMDIESIEKGGYSHFMLKEIFEQPRSIYDTFRGRVSKNNDAIYLGGLQDVMPRIKKANRIIIVACGTSWHAGLIGEYLIEEFAQIPVEVEYASEFRYRNPIINPSDVVIAISQSGETADTLEAIRLAKSKGALVIGICNVVGSSIPRLTDAGVYTHAGPEIGVASTKAFTAQVTVLTMIAFKLGKELNRISDERFRELLTDLNSIPKKIEQILSLEGEIYEIAKKYADSRNFLYLGRGYNFPVALEGALKLKEISYIHAEGYPAAEMKHGPIALIDEKMPVVVIATRRGLYEKVITNIEEVKARKGIIIAIVSEGDTVVEKIADHVIKIPYVEEPLAPLLSSIPLQILSYQIAVIRGCNVDQPRNLAKSVTVE